MGKYEDEAAAALELDTLNVVSSVVKQGNRRASLVAIRDNLATRLDTCPPREVAPIAKQLVDTIREIEDLPIEKEESLVDQLARKRTERRTGT